RGECPTDSDEGRLCHILLNGSLLNGDRLPAALTTDENAHVPEPAAERSTAKRSVVDRDASYNGNLTVDARRDTVAPRGHHSKVASAKILYVVALGSDLAGPRYLDELVRDHS